MSKGKSHKKPELYLSCPQCDNVMIPFKIRSTPKLGFACRNYECDYGEWSTTETNFNDALLDCFTLKEITIG
jgi:hypothetical protein